MTVRADLAHTPDPLPKRGACAPVGDRLLRIIAATLAGPLTLLGFAPFSLPVLPLAGPALLFLAVRRGRATPAFFLGWLYGLAFALPGMIWVQRLGTGLNAAEPGWALLVAVVAIAGVATVYGLVGLVFVLLRRGAPGGDPGEALLFAALWFLAELARGQALLGLPAWLAIGYAQIDTPLAGWAPVIGVHGVGFMAVLSAALLVAAPGRGRYYGAVSSALIWGAGAGLAAVDWTAASGPAIPVALVQRGALTEVRAQEDQTRNLAVLERLQAQAAAHAALVVWGESALDQTSVTGLAAPFFAALHRDLAARNQHLIFGMLDVDTERRVIHNALVALGGPPSRYDKRILAPFGETMPRGRWLDPLWQWLGLYYPGSMVPGRAERPLLQVGAWPVGVAICYEIGFGAQLRPALPAAAFLVNVANDHWFDGTLEPDQHLEVTRMRALETGRWLLRATLTGHTAIIGPDGAIAGRIPPGVSDVLEGTIVPRQGATPYVARGDGPLLLFSAALLLLAAGIRLARPRMLPNRR